MRVFLGFDAQEMRACNVAARSLALHTDRSMVSIERLCMLALGKRYTRPTTLTPNGRLFDELSDAPMSTDHAIARFFIPFLMDYGGVALFTDGDVLLRENVADLFALADPRYAVQVVQHPPLLEEGFKKDGHVQQVYARKNWSSVMLWNCGHEANRALTLDVLNAWPGRDLHAFRWLTDEQIGSLPGRWNHLVNVSPETADVALAHFTLGAPDVSGHEADPFADEWWSVARSAGYRRPAAVPVGVFA